MRENKQKKFHALQILFVIAILSVFTLLFIRYYGSRLVENQRFVSADYQSLEEEASQIVSSYGKTNKTADDVFVLTYHAITKQPTESEFRIYYDNFKETMFALKREGYQTITLDDFYKFMNGEKELPDKSFLLTFDDGAKQSYYNGDPVLEALGYNAVLSIITSHSIDAPESVYYLSESELIEAYKTGRWEMVSHTDSLHYRLPVNSQGERAPAMANKIWIPEENRIETNEEYYNRILNDLENAENKLERTFNQSVTTFVLPYGDFGEKRTNYPEANDILFDLTTSKYKLVFYEFPYKYRIYRSNYNDAPGKGSHIVSRIPADYLSREPKEIIDLIEAMRAKELPYYENYENQDNWVRISGSASFTNESIILFPDAETSGPSSITTYLDGSYLWKDYIFSIELKNSNVESVSLVSRFKGPEDYVACKFQNDSVWIIKKEKGFSQLTVAKENIPENRTLNPNSKISMEISGDNAVCYLEGKKIVSSKVEGIPDYGGAGIKIDGFSEDNKFTFGGVSVLELNNPEL